MQVVGEGAAGVDTSGTRKFAFGALGLAIAIALFAVWAKTYRPAVVQTAAVQAPRAAPGAASAEPSEPSGRNAAGAIVGEDIKSLPHSNTNEPAGQQVADAAHGVAGTVSQTAAGTGTQTAIGTVPEPKLKLDTKFESAKRIVPFAFNRGVAGPTGKLAVQELVPLAKRAEKVYVRGRTDSTGSRATNRLVALNRAFAVRTAFVRAGVKQQKIGLSYCTTCFIAPNDSEQGRRMNRRVDVELLMPAEEIAALPKPVHALEYPEPGAPKLVADKSIVSKVARE